MSRYERLERAAAQGRPVVLAGPMGSELVRSGVRWRGHGMLSDERAVQDLYEEYFHAGADVVRSNTFQLNRRIYLDVFRDEAHRRHIGAPGLERRHLDLTRKAMDLARAARERAGPLHVAIAGVMGPLEHCFRPDLAPAADDAFREHRELAEALAEGGADLLLLESFNTLAECRAALRAARETGLPAWVSFALGPEGDLLGGEDLRVAARAVRQEGARVVLVNAIPIHAVDSAIPALVEGGLAGAFPMVGRYDPPSWKFEFFPRFRDDADWSAEKVAEAALGWVRRGVSVVGTCGASGPRHTRALAEAARRFEARPAE